MTLLSVEDLSISFVQYEEGLRRVHLDVVTGLDLQVGEGELVAVVGASGSGKSLLAHAVLGLLPTNAVEGGKILYDGAILDTERRGQLRGTEIALVPQSVTFLDPVTRVGKQTARAARLAGHADPEAVTADAYRRRELSEGTVRLYPHELSGGMARRVLAATATIGEPRLIIADEPTPGLHEEVVAETLADLRRLADQGTAVVLITHDLEAAADIADRVAVFDAGRTVEQVDADAFSGDGARLHHPYSRALWRALPANGFHDRSADQLPPAPIPDTSTNRPPSASGLEARQLRFAFHRRTPPVVDGTDLTVRRGEVVGLAGPSGSGKTTLGRLLSGYLVPDRGSITVDGRPLTATQPTPVQLIFQHPELAVDPRWRLGETLAEAGPVDSQLLEELAIDPGLLSRFPHEVSGGELQRIAVARALMTGAPFLIADEMSAMLDALTQAQLWHAVLRRVRSGDLGVLAISHDRPLLETVADRLLRSYDQNVASHATFSP